MIRDMKLIQIDIEKIEANPNQPRKQFDEEKLAELSESIKNNGLLQPITVKRTSSGKYEIVAGERRYRACKRAGITHVPVIEIKVGDMKGYELALMENIQRVDLNPIEEAESYLMLTEVYGYTQEKLAEKLGKTRSSLSNKMRILKLPEKVKEMVKLGKLSYGHARTLLALNNEDKIIKMAEEISEKGYSVRETEEKVKSQSSKGMSEKENNHEIHIPHIKPDMERKEKMTEEEGYDTGNIGELKYIEDKLREFFESKVQIRGNLHGSGRIEINFDGYSDVSRIIGLLDIDFE